MNAAFSRYGRFMISGLGVGGAVNVFLETLQGNSNQRTTAGAGFSP
jgi:hypothetical protein